MQDVHYKWTLKQSLTVGLKSRITEDVLNSDQNIEKRDHKRVTRNGGYIENNTLRIKTRF